MSFLGRKTTMPEASRTLPGRSAEMRIGGQHTVLGTPLKPPFPEGSEQAIFGMGCFWGAEREFWQAPGVYTTAVGYAGGFTPNPTYEEVCSRPHRPHRGRARRLRPRARSRYEELLAAVLGEPRPHPGHAPGQRRRHAVPLGDLRATTDEQRARAEASRDAYQAGASPGRATARSRPRSPRPAPSTTPRTTTSSTWPRTRAGTAASAARASVARSGCSPPPDRRLNLPIVGSTAKPGRVT